MELLHRVKPGHDQYVKQPSYSTVSTADTDTDASLDDSESFCPQPLDIDDHDEDHHQPPSNPENQNNSNSRRACCSSSSSSTFALCLCTLVHSYLLTSVFPYAGFMAIKLTDANEETAGTYAGLIASMFMFGRMVSSYAWGQIGDTYGRTFCLYASLLSSGTFTLLFGLAPNFGMALLSRFCLGLGNGIVGTVKTTVSELARGDDKLESRAMGMTMAMWGWGFLVGPALSGMISEPVRQYPEFWNSGCDSDNAEKNCDWSWTRRLLSQYPFFLPNLLGGILCLCAVASVRAFVEETLPLEQRRPIRCIPGDIVQLCNDVCRRLSFGLCSTGHVPVATSDIEAPPLSKSESIMVNDDESADETSNHDRATISSLWAHRNLRSHLILYWGSSLVGMALDEIFPLFCISQQAGLGLTEASIGKILSFSGLLFVVFQYPFFAFMVHRLGIYGSIRWGLVVMMSLVFVFPTILLVNKKNHDNDDDDDLDKHNSLTWTTLIYSGTLLAFYRLFGNLFFSNISVATNRTVPATHRATMNGFSMLGGSAVKGTGPFLAGVVFAFSVSSNIFPARVGIIIPFVLVGMWGLIMSTMAFALADPDQNCDTKNESELTS